MSDDALVQQVVDSRDAYLRKKDLDVCVSSCSSRGIGGERIWLSGENVWQRSSGRERVWRNVARLRV